MLRRIINCDDVLRVFSSYPGNMAIIDDIYDAMTDEAAYLRLPGVLADAVSSRSGIVMEMDLNGLPLSMNYTYFTADMYRIYHDMGLHQHDVWTHTVRRLALFDRAIVVDRLVAPEAFISSYFYQAMFKSNGDDTARSIGAILSRKDGLTAVAFNRAYGQCPFDESDAATLDALIPHIKRLAAMRKRLGAAEQKQLISQNALNALNCALFVTDASGAIQLMNAAAEDLMKTRRIVVMASGKLVTADAQGAEAFSHALTSAAKRTAGHGGALRLRDACGVLQVLIAPLPGPVAAALILINDADPGPLPTRLLNQLYGLTPAEADLAAMLAQGLTPAEAAEKRTVSMATVRTQIQRVMSKLDARNLTDIARLLARIPRLKP